MDSKAIHAGLISSDVTSDTEVKLRREDCLSSNSSENNESPQNSEDYDEDTIYPENLLKVEVNESDEIICPSNFIERKPIKRRLLDTLPVPKKSVRLRNKEQKIIIETVKTDPPKEVIKKYQEESEFICKVCKRRCPTRTKLKRHVRSHQGGNIKCPVCRAPFKTNKVLGRHIVLIHEKTVKCDKCSKTFYTKQQLIEHNQKNKHTFKTEPTENIYGNLSGDIKAINREDVSHDIQTAIVSKLHKAVPVKDICRLYNIIPEVVNEIWKDRDQFILPKKIGRRTIAYVNSTLEPLLLEWYNNEKSKDVYITGRMIQNVAEQIAKEKGFVHFNAGNKWLEGFKKRHNIYLSNRKERTKLLTEPAWKSKFFEDNWQNIRQKYADSEIYAADEVGLFYNPSKSRERKFAGKKFVQGEMEDRLSIFMCVNMSGTDKRKLLVCSTADPLKNFNRNPSTLPVHYKRHSQCYFTTDMFEEYVQEWNEDLKKYDQKALLLLDRASIHSKLEMSNLQLEFLPWKAMNTLMPIRNGLFATLRTEFRNLLLRFKTANVIKGQDRNLTCFEALEMLEKAWQQTSPYFITKSFLDVGFEVQELSGTEIFNVDIDGEQFCEILKDYDVESYFTDTSTLDMYLTVDEDLVVGKGTKPSLFGGNHKVKVESFPDTTDSGKDLPLNTGIPLSNEVEMSIINIRNTQAEADLEMIRKHLPTKYDTNLERFHFIDVNKEDTFVNVNE